MNTKELIPNKTVVVFHKAPPFKDEDMEGRLAIFHDWCCTGSNIQFWLDEEQGDQVFCSLCTVGAVYEILGEL